MTKSHSEPELTSQQVMELDRAASTFAQVRSKLGGVNRSELQLSSDLPEDLRESAAELEKLIRTAEALAESLRKLAVAILGETSRVD